MMRPGFTLLYLGVFLGLVMIMLGLSVPRFMFIQKQAVYVELYKLRQICLALRQRALATGLPQTIFLDIKNNRYNGGGYYEQLSSGVQFNTLSNVQGPPSHPTHPLYTPSTFKNNSIILYPDGIIESGTLYVTDAQKTVLYALSSGVGHTSLIRIYTYNGSWELLE